MIQYTHPQLRAVMDELLRTTVVFRKDAIANEGGALIGAALEAVHLTDTEAAREAILTDVFPWIFGPRSIMPLLEKITSAYDRGELPPGIQIYNALLIVHQLDRSGALLRAFETYARDDVQPLLQPNPLLCFV